MELNVVASEPNGCTQYHVSYRDKRGWSGIVASLIRMDGRWYLYSAGPTLVGEDGETGRDLLAAHYGRSVAAAASVHSNGFARSIDA